MTASPRRRAVTPSQLRGVMLGRAIEGVEVVRQAYRIFTDDSDELVLVNARGQWWVARRASDRITLWAFVGDSEAEDAFERLLHDDAHPGADADDLEWHQATA
jgi:hypothetical protein